jgi:hypothetical protein
MYLPLPPTLDGALPAEHDTRHPAFPLWLLHQGMGPLFRVLREAGLLARPAPCAALARAMSVAATCSRMLLDRVAAEQVRPMLLALAVEELLLQPEGELPRVPLPVWRPTADEAEVLRTFSQTGSWKMDRPAALVAEVKDRVRQAAVRKLDPPDALLVGLMLTVGGRLEEASRMLDLDDQVARETLGRVWRRFEGAALLVVQQALRRGKKH